MNTFSIERGDNVLHNVFFGDENNKMSNVTEMSFDELVNYDGLSDLVDAMLDATDDAFGPSCEDVFITLVDGNGYFIWSISIEQCDSDFNYQIIDWSQSDDKFCYGESGSCN